MKQILLFLCLTFSFTLFSQIHYEKAYYITNDGEKIEGYIQNKDWRHTPKSFNFKSSLTSDSEIISISDAKIFAFENFKKFERFTVDIDNSETQLKDFDTHRNPVFEEKIMYLELLVRGNANLYVNRDKKTKNKYFFSTSSSFPVQLVFKEYLVKLRNNGTPKVAENNYYKQQILNSLTCESINTRKVTSLNYKERSLTNIFEAYNNCKNEDYTPYFKEKNSPNSISFSIRPGMTYSFLEFNYVNGIGAEHIEKLDSKISYRIGLELEYILPFNNNKWGIILEPVYTHYKSEKRISDKDDNIFVDSSENLDVSYNSLGIQAGMRHYFFLNDTSKLFINATYYQEISTPNSFIDFEKSKDLDFKSSSNNIAIGAGYNWNKKVAFEINYILKRETLPYVNRSGKYNQLSLILSYNIL